MTKQNDRSKLPLSFDLRQLEHPWDGFSV